MKIIKGKKKNRVLGITVITVYNSPNCLLVLHTALGTINTQAALHVKEDIIY